MAGDNIKDFTAINLWYERLDTRYNFSLGPVVLPLLKTDNLIQLAKLDPPYLKDFKASIDEHQLDNISTVFGKNLRKVVTKTHIIVYNLMTDCKRSAILYNFHKFDPYDFFDGTSIV